MTLKLSTPFLLAASLAVAGCATQAARDTAPGDVCTDTRDVDMGLLGNASSRQYNADCAARLARSTMMNSPDPGMRALGVAAAAEAGDVDPATLSRISHQLQHGNSVECTVTAVRRGQATLSCPRPALVATGPR